MANIKYRVSNDDANIPASSSIKGAPLTNVEIDGNFRSVQKDLAEKAPLNSPSLTGTPVAPTAATGTNTTQIATTEFVIGERSASSTLTNKTLTSPVINGGSVDGATLGATTPAAASFTNLAASGTVTFSSTGAMKVPTGTEAQRPGGVNGLIRYNTTTQTFEGYSGGVWGAIGGGAGATGGSTDNAVFWENDKTVTVNYTITAGKNAGTFGPVSVADGIVVTVPDGSVWTIV